MNKLFIDYIIAGFGIFIFSIFLHLSKPNSIYGIRTSATLSDPEVWKKTNKLGSIIFSSISLIYIFLNFLYYFLNLTDNYYNFTGLIFFVSIIITTIYLSYYSRNLLFKMDKKIDISLTKSLVYISLLLSILTIVIGIILPFTSPNSLIGIRISKTLNNIILWKKVNTFSGIGFIIIGFTFSYIFYKNINLIDKDKEKFVFLFMKNQFYFFISLLGLCLFSILIVYIV